MGLLTFADSNRRPGSIKEKSTDATDCPEEEEIKELTQNTRAA